MPPRKVPDGERRARQAGRLARVLRVLELIQGRGQYGVVEIAAELECSTRTVFRDLAVLQLAGVSYYHDKETKSLQVRPGFKFPTLHLDDAELIGQATASVITSAPGLDVTKGAGPTTRKLRATAKEKASELLAEVERVTSVLNLKLADHGRHHEAIKTVQRALIEGRRLIGTYVSPYHARPKPLDLHPYRLCLVNQAWYLVARPEDLDQPQTYRVARFQALLPSDLPSVVPETFDLSEYFGNSWGVYRGARPYQVDVRFTRDAAELVAETTWHPTQKVDRHDDGSVTLNFLVDGLEEVVHWVLGWSGRAIVVQPPELRAMVLDHLQKAMDLNRG